MGANISIYPVIHSHRKDKTGRVPIVLRIDLDNNPVAYDPIGEKANKVPAEYWDAETRSVKKHYANAALLNNIISKRRTELEGIFLIKEQMGLKLTKRNIKLIVAGKDPGRCFFEFCEKQIKDKYESAETIRTYNSELTKLKLFAAELSFRDIDYQFLQEYAAWMRDKRGNSANTIWKTFKFMNTMMNDALRIGGIIQENPFSKFDRGAYKQTQRTFLTKADRPKVEKLLTEPIPAELAKVVAYMLLMCYCGLRFEDAMAFDYTTHIVDDERLIMETQKKDVLVNIKLYPKLREIILFVRDNPLQLTNQQFNTMLKVVATMAGINKTLTAHVGRHTFGRLLAENGVAKEKAQKLLGHRDIRSTNIYYHMMDTDLDNEVDNKLAHLE